MIVHPMPVYDSEIDTTPVYGSVRQLEAIQVHVVDHTPWEPLWNDLMKRHHYLGFQKMVGRQMKYLVFSGTRPMAAVGWRSASLKLGVRDRYIGWSIEQKAKHLPQLANNNRFLIFPWISVQNLASHLLARTVKALQVDWEAKYGHRLLLLETFVDPSRFRGTTYRAGNWVQLGQTKGFTKEGRTYRYHGHPKEVYVYPLDPDFRAVIGCRQNPPRPKFLRPFPGKGDLMMIAHQNDWHPDILEENGITPETVDQLAKRLVDFHEAFAPALNHVKQRTYGAVLLKGLLSNLPRKSIEPIALNYLDTNHVRAMQRFMTNATWDEQQMKEIYHERVAASITTADSVHAMITLDSSENPKKGKESVGVARQYCGRLGKVENCQSGVYVGYTTPKGYALLDSQLFMPEIWFTPEYDDRRRACSVPEDLTFKTKPEIAQSLVKGIRDTDHFPAQWLGMDAVFGNNPKFLDAVAPHFWYFAAIRSNTQVWLDWPDIELPRYKGRGRRPKGLHVLTPAVTVASVAKAPDTQWTTVTLAEGAKGPLTAEVARRRVIVSRGGFPYEEVWLILRKHPDGELKYALSNAPIETSLEDMAQASVMRWPIEQCFGNAKGYVGMDQYELRSWHGWHRHMLYVFLALLFLLEVQWHFVKKGLNFRS